MNGEIKNVNAVDKMLLLRKLYTDYMFLKKEQKENLYILEHSDSK